MKGLSLIALASAVMVAVGATKTTLSSVESTTSTGSACSLVTSTAYAINTKLENPTKWLASINRKYYRGQHSWSDSIPIFTATVEHAGSMVPAIGYVASGILEIEGYKITSSVVTATACGTTQPSSDPDSICHLSNNDGNCEGDGVNPGRYECVAHNDHWHCPVGIDPPSDHPGRPGRFTSQNDGNTSCFATVIASVLFGIAVVAVMCM
ncbi:unnamed protein product [Clonostachys chloroleuca]|uniref:Uncharacterized protein n=1 Tax=Clonostachys chloroleuca TaxID=1926264 RepID=A0AA35M8E2_9HYPO|nr:unnamed protein product [Clonostachys chloroleuca]